MLRRKTSLFAIFSLIILTLAASVHADDGAISSLRQTGKAFASVAKQVSPSVVLIKVEAKPDDRTATPFNSPFGDDLMRRFFGDQQPGIPQQQPEHEQVVGQGSGFVFRLNKGLLSSSSYVLTNNHVVQNAEKIRVTFMDGSEFDAKVTGTDAKSDVAVLEIADTSHPALNLGNSSQLDVGEWVIAVGNPFGLSHTLTVGVVSAKGRTGLGINDYEDFIQTDAAINPGNSGGPLLNLDGQVIGINTAIFSRSGGNMGVGFAIPVDLARNIADQLIDKGKVTRGFLGIVIQDLTPELAESFGIKEHKGVLVAQVSPDSPAAKAGMKAGDLIVAYRGNEVSQVADFRNRVAQTPPGSKENLKIIREGKSMTIPVAIGNLDGAQKVAGVANQGGDAMGFSVQDLTPQLARQLAVDSDHGVVVSSVQPGSAAARAGLDTGAVILQVNRQDIKNVTDFDKALHAGEGKRVLLLVSQQGGSRYIVLNLG